MMSGGVRESLLSGLECENHATIVLDHARVRMWVIHGVLERELRRENREINAFWPLRNVRNGLPETCDTCANDTSPSRHTLHIRDTWASLESRASWAHVAYRANDR